MHFERLTDADDPRLPAALALYGASFPPHEQRQTASQRTILQNEEYHFDLVYDGETWVGLMLNWETADFVYVEHFCISPEKRNHQYGARALALLRERGRNVILEIDPPADDISRRRKGFYERCGFAENPYPHIHPPYHAENHGHDLVVMSCPRALKAAEYDAFAEYLTDTVMSACY